MQLEIIIDCSNDAFGEDSIARGQELANILGALIAVLIDEGLAPGELLSLRDRNANMVGHAQLSE